MARIGGSLMQREMRDQPDVLTRIFDRRHELQARVRDVLPDRPAGITLIARGSSDHAAIFGRYLLEIAAGRPAALAAPSIHTVYGRQTEHDGWLAVAVSQSGETPEVVRVLKNLQRRGAVGVAVTNVGDSALAVAADAVLDLHAGEELAIPATKTFTAELAAFVVIAEALGRVPWTTRDLRKVPGTVARVLEDVPPIRIVAPQLADRHSLLCAGRGYLFPIALEAALKLKEVARIHAEGYSSADLRHGPITLASEDTPVVAFLTPGPSWRDVNDLIERLRARSVNVYVVGDDRSALVPVPAGLPEPLVVFPAAVRAQQLALECARLRGIDPDHPVGLAKVTR